VASSGAFPPQACWKLHAVPRSRAPCLRNAALSKFTVTQMLPQLACACRGCNCRTSCHDAGLPSPRPYCSHLDPDLTCSVREGLR